MKKGAVPVMALLGAMTLLEYHWLSGGAFSLPLGALILTGGLAASLLREPFPGGRLPLLSLASGTAFPWLLKGVLFLFFMPFAGKGGYGYILFDTDFSLILPLYYPVFLFFLFSRRRPQDAPLLLSFLVLLSGTGFLLFPEGERVRRDYLLSLAGAGVLFFLGILYLILFRQLRLYHRRSARRRAEGGRNILLLFLPGLLFLFRSYREKSLAAGGGLLRSEYFQFDFSDVLTLQPEIAMSDEMVMLFRKEGEAERLLIRRHVLGEYDGERGFYRSSGDRDIPAGGLRYEDPGYENRIDVLQEFYLINMNPTASLGLNYPVEIEAFREWGGSSFQKVLRTRSRVEDIRRRDLYGERVIRMGGEERAAYTFYGGREDIAGLAREIAGPFGTPYGKARAVERYLKDNYFYSLKPGSSLHGDQLGYFLFVSKKGYCSYFAFAMTLMLRSLDIPARVAVGFWVDPDSEVLNFYPVPANQAHAWVEVFFNEKGWIEFDPTSENPALGENFRFGSVDLELYNSLIEEIIQNGDELSPEKARPLRERAESSFERAGALWERHSRRASALLLLSYGIWVFLSRYAPFVSRRSAPARKAVALYIGKIKQLHRAGYPGRPGETPWEYAGRMQRLTDLPMVELTELYLQAEFASRFDDAEDIGRERIRARYREAWKSMPPFRRFLSALYPLPQIRRYL